MKMLRFEDENQLKAHLMNVMDLSEEDADKAIKHANLLQRVDQLLRGLFTTYAVTPHTPELIAVIATGFRGLAEIVENPDDWDKINARIVEECEAITKMIDPVGSA